MPQPTPPSRAIARVVVTAIAILPILSPTLIACAQAATPDLILIDGHRITQLRDALSTTPTPDLAAAAKQLIKQADDALAEPITTVVNKPTLPSSGNKHDYMSLSPYWWPNPDTPNGLPYVRRDGEVNPDRNLYDLPALDLMSTAVRDLALAYFYTGNEAYAQNAAERLRVWFIDDATRMTPRMQFGQFRPGLSEGSKSGIIETVRLRWTPDAITLLSQSEALSEADLAALKQWFDDYKTWLMTSEMGTAELASGNNHGTWCAMQIALFASFAGDDETVRQTCEQIKKRIAAQYETDGKQEHELARTRALEYSDFNNRAMLELAHMGQRVGVDLWNYTTPDGRSLRKGIDLLIPYMIGESEWTYQQTRTPRYDRFAQGLRRAAVGFNDPAYEQALQKIPHEAGPDVWLQLVLPLPDTFPAKIVETATASASN